MVNAVVLGAGPVGLAISSLLGRRGLTVTILERDPAERPLDAEIAWRSWRRPGVAQFRQAHNLLPGGYRLVREHLPSVIDALVANGGHQLDLTALAPPTLQRTEWLADAERITTINARRPILEHAFASAAEATAGVVVRRGVEVDELTVGPSVVPGVPHITGVRTTDGEQFEADVVIDVTGRSSALPTRLVASGARPPAEVREPKAFVYSTRFFRSRNGSMPPVMAPLLSPIGSFSILTLPSDNGTWSITLYASAADQEMRSVRDAAVFDRVVRACPLHAHWLDGEPLTGVDVMSSALGRRRTFRVGASPVSTGLLAVGDAWAYTNPSLGRGISLGLKHAVQVADLALAHLDAPAVLTEAWMEMTEREMGPWYDATVKGDRIRLAEMDACRLGTSVPFDPADRGDVVSRALAAAIQRDAEVYHGFLEIVSCLALPADVLARPGFLDLVLTVADGDGPAPLPGPNRGELLALLSSELAPA